MNDGSRFVRAGFVPFIAFSFVLVAHDSALPNRRRVQPPTREQLSDS